MGGGYSAEQQKTFEPYRMMIDRAINDKDYADFVLQRDRFVSDLKKKVPLANQER